MIKDGNNPIYNKDAVMSEANQDKCICCAGPVGPQGIPGVQGPQGNQGPRGEMGVPGIRGCEGNPGKDGKDGLDGPMGPMGPQGLQGQQGPKGDCVACPCDCGEPEFAEVYSNMNQVLSPSPGPNLAGGVINLEKTIFATANIDVSQSGINGKITVNKAGWYDVSTGICGALNPIGIPLPVWTLSLFLNGLIVPGSTFANQTISPDQQSNEVVADVFVHFNKGDVLELANTSIAQLNVNAPTLGTNAIPSSGYLKIILLKAD